MKYIIQNEDIKCIYGAGKYGQLLLNFFNSVGTKIDYFIQTQEPKNKEIKGVCVLSFNDLLNMKGNKIVFLAINNEKDIRIIKKNILYQDKRKNIIVYDCKNFINDNLMYNKSNITSGHKFCIICDNYVDKFYPAGSNEKIFKNHHIIGGGYRENAICPCCGYWDRGRWLQYVLKNKTNISYLKGSILHFAPEQHVSTFIKNNEFIDYHTGDIIFGRAMHIIDITNIQYKDETFDYVICNHVMEHILDEARAVDEIKRVLKKDGKWIFSFPICTDTKTIEDDTIISSEKKLEFYGQEDHVRLYGYDYVDRFKKYGLKLQIFTPKNELDDLEIEKYGFIKDDVIIIATKE